MNNFIAYSKFVLIGFASGIFIALLALNIFQMKIINVYADMFKFTKSEMEIMKRMTTVSLMADPQKNFRDSRFEDRLALYEYITNN